MDFIFIITSLLKIAILLVVILFMVSYAVYAERRVSAFIQDRLGPNRVGPAGLLPAHRRHVQAAAERRFHAARRRIRFITGWRRAWQ